jgi:hypothetical protein
MRLATPRHWNAGSTATDEIGTTRRRQYGNSPDSPLEGTGFEPSVPLLPFRDGGVHQEIMDPALSKPHEALARWQTAKADL